MTTKKAPVIAALTPAKADLYAGRKYFWCACGLSARQPYCDGSHKGTGIEPLAVTAQESGVAFMCQCKATNNPPYCDGSHSGLGDARPGDELAAGD